MAEAAHDGLVEAVEAAASGVAPAVVRLGRDRRGSGIILAPGQVLTNAHNLRSGEITVAFSDGQIGTGRVAGHDLDADLAVVLVETGDRAAITWGDGAPVRLGATVLAVGSALDGSPRVTVGNVSGIGRAFRGPRGRRILQAIEHTAALPRGSSGGPLVDLGGRLVGMNTHRLGEGFYLAVPADDALRQRAEALASGAHPVPRRLGVGLAPVEVARSLRAAVGLPAVDGLLVRSIEVGAPAHAAGIRKGDLLVVAGGSELSSVDVLHAALDALDEGDPLVLEIVRGVERIEVQVSFEGTTAEGEA